MFNLKQISLCYLARVVGKKGEPDFTEEELENGFEIKWLPIQTAVSLLSRDSPKSKEGELFIVPRDKTFLETVRSGLADFDSYNFES
jgi:hypothetical protein